MLQMLLRFGPFDFLPHRRQRTGRVVAQPCSAHPKRARYQAALRPHRYADGDAAGNRKDRIAAASATSRLSPAFEKRQESAQRIAQIEQHFAAQELRRAFRRMPLASAFHLEISFVLAQKPARARDGESFIVEQPFHPEDHVNVTLPVVPLTPGALDPLPQGEFGFSVTPLSTFFTPQPPSF